MSSKQIGPGSTVGFVGLGNMGRPMARRLAEAGYQVQAYDPSPDAVGELSGVPGIKITRDVATSADAVLLMLPNSDVVESVLLGDGLLAVVEQDCIVVDMGSSEPARTRAISTVAAERGVQFVDAPVSGGVGGAVAGTLTIMVGGPSETVRRLDPLFRALGSNVVYAGELVGAGHAVKALNNLLSAAHLLASSEALLAAQAFGLDLGVVLEILNASSGKSGSTENKWPKFVLPATFDSGFALRLMLKDMKTGLALEEDLGIPAPLGRAAVDAWSQAAEALPESADHTEIVRWLQRQRAGQPSDAQAEEQS